MILHSLGRFLSAPIFFDYRQEYQKAIADYTKAIDLQPDYASAYFNRGNVHYYLVTLVSATVELLPYRERPQSKLLHRKVKDYSVDTLL